MKNTPIKSTNYNRPTSSGYSRIYVRVNGEDTPLLASLNEKAKEGLTIMQAFVSLGIYGKTN